MEDQEMKDAVMKDRENWVLLRGEKRVLLRDAEGRLYAVPESQARAGELTEKQATALVREDSKERQQEVLDTLDVLTQLDNKELPNFRLLMQTEYA